MLDPDDGCALAAPPLDGAGNALGGCRAEPGQGLVEEQERGLEREHSGELQALSLPHAQVARRAAAERRKIELLEKFFLVARDSSALRRKRDVLTHGPLRKRPGCLKRPTHAASSPRCRATRRRGASQEDRSSRARKPSGNRQEKRRLARAVGPEHLENLPGLDREA